MADDAVEPKGVSIHLERRPSPKRLKLAAIVAICLAAAVVVAGLASRIYDSSKLKTWTSIQSIPPVNVIRPTSQTAGQTLTLPGSLQADFNAPIYSRVSGYVHAWYDDIGSRVKAGTVLATIDTPELDE